MVYVEQRNNNELTFKCQLDNSIRKGRIISFIDFHEKVDETDNRAHLFSMFTLWCQSNSYIIIIIIIMLSYRNLRAQ